MRDLDELGIDLQVLSLGPPGYDGGSVQQSVDLARRFNESLAEVVSAYPDRFRGLASLPLRDVDAAVAELERGVDELGLSGAQVFSSSDCRYLDDRAFWPVYEAAEKRKIPILVHPNTSECAAQLADMGLTLDLGFLHETVVTASRLVMSGTMASFPALNLVLCHMGAYLPIVIARFDVKVAAWRRLGREIPWAFERLLDQDLEREGGKDVLSRAVQIYREDLLEGTYCEWVEPLRVQCRSRFLDALVRLAEEYSNEGDDKEAGELLFRAIAVDPSRTLCIAGPCSSKENSVAERKSSAFATIW